MSEPVLLSKRAVECAKAVQNVMWRTRACSPEELQVIIDRHIQSAVKEEMESADKVMRNESELIHIYISKITALEKRVKELESMLGELEFCAAHESEGRGHYCHKCGGFEGEGHKPDCALAALLKGGEK